MSFDISLLLGCRFGGTLFVKMIGLHSLPPRRHGGVLDF